MLEDYEDRHRISELWQWGKGEGMGLGKRGEGDEMVGTKLPATW